VISFGLVLSLFPGIGLLDRAFEHEGFAVVRGPDLIWGGDIRSFHVPPERFDGVIGGPPCQRFSPLNQAGRKGLQPLAENMIPEFERVVHEARPQWFVMENVEAAPLAQCDGYAHASRLINNRWYGGEQNRARRFTFGGSQHQCRDWARSIDMQQIPFENIDKANCFTANGTQWDSSKGRSRSQRTRTELAKGLRLQGLPADYLDHSPFTIEGAIHAVGNGVPMVLGLAVARSVKAAMGEE